MVRSTARAAALFALTAPPALAESPPVGLTQAIEAAAADCASFQGGALTLPEDAPRPLDLDGVGNGWVLDFADLSCSTMASFACGTGGCRVMFAVGDHVTERFAAGWSVMDFGPVPVVLLDVHGALCGGANPTPCVEAMVWDGATGQFSTLAPREQ